MYKSGKNYVYFVIVLEWK